MTLLKEMIEDIINENEDGAKVNFHSYLTTKMKTINEGVEKIRISNELADKFLDEAEKLFKNAEFKPTKGDFYTTIEVECDDSDELNKIVQMADDFE